jgi:hypothetical protein
VFKIGLLFISKDLNTPRSFIDLVEAQKEARKNQMI